MASDPDKAAVYLCEDRLSRLAEAGSLYVARRGESADGHDFVEAALGNGAVASLAEREVPGAYVLGPDVQEAFARLASTEQHREVLTSQERHQVLHRRRDVVGLGRVVLGELGEPHRRLAVDARLPRCEPLVPRGFGRARRTLDDDQGARCEPAALDERVDGLTQLLLTDRVRRVHEDQGGLHSGGLVEESLDGLRHDTHRREPEVAHVRADDGRDAAVDLDERRGRGAAAGAGQRRARISAWGMSSQPIATSTRPRPKNENAR